ncbi:glycosyltransferase [Aquirufa antheringensis]|uniref:glycosyltransferase n=1 Tax=Aquirufa antheringensis TaxID=2516559 RepID=UPI001032B339|nr:glycosyltransferase [Aquirufa antheringensis]TBH71736.1 glycosyltransferase [Aquirufa antheringensis]
MANNKVLVLLCSYNGGQFIYDQIKSILLQKKVMIEIYVFDDGSTDNTLDVINGFDDSRIKLFKNKSNSGSAALNFINAICSIPFEVYNKFDCVALSDQDDIWLDFKIYCAVNKIEESHVDLYCSNLTIWDTNSNTKTLLKKNYKQVKFDYLFEGGSAGCTYVMPSNLVHEMSNYFKKLNFTNWKFISHDWLIYFYCRINKKDVFIDTNSYILYRIHSSNVHGSMNILSINSFFKRAQLFFSGWYAYQSTNFKENFLDPHQDEYEIYYLYNLNWFTRIFVILKYNTQLFRDRRKFIVFLFFNIFNFINHK